MRSPFAQATSGGLAASRKPHLGGRSLLFEQLESRRYLSLTHWYTFNNGSGEDLIGDADVTIVNGANVANGQVVLNNGSITSGQTTSVQYINMPAVALPTSGSMTVSVWFTSYNSLNFTRVFDFGNQVRGVADSYLFYTPQTSNNDSRFVISTSGGVPNERGVTGATTDDGVEHLVTGVIDTATNMLRLYLDGAEVGTASLAGADMASLTKTVAYFGRSIFNADPGFTGSINEIQIHDEALSAAAIADKATTGPTGDVTDPEPPTPLPARQMEDLNRGLIALRRATNQVYVGWRMLGTDPADVSFNLYRAANGGTAQKINGAPLTQTTDFVDSAANMTVTNTYYVRPIIAGIELAPSESFTLAANAPINQYLNVPLQVPAGGSVPDHENPGQFLNYTYNANDASVGDVDGDGEYEIILKWDPSNAKDNSQAGHTGNVYIDAYKLNGTLLWRIDLGRNIRAGAHYTQFMVYDLDGDGKAEVAMRTAPGTLDGTGEAVLMGSDLVTADYRNSSGYIITGSEYLTVFNGETGAEMVTIPFEPGRGSASQWGDSYGNRVDRFLGGIAYLDGVHPSLIMARGYYGPQNSSGQARNEIVAYDFQNGELTQRWHFKAGYNINGNINSNYIGQGAHSLSIADVDGDGFDEIIYGAAAIDHNGVGLYSTGLGHGDALHVSDMDPARPGLEVFMPHESPGSNGNIVASFRDAATGQILSSQSGTSDNGRGVAQDVDPNHLGYEYWSSAAPSIYDAQGNAIYGKGNIHQNFGIWWDADLLRETLDGTTIANWNYDIQGRQNILSSGSSGINSTSGLLSNNGTKSTPALSGDIFGDWREEVIWRASDNTALRIYSTTVSATNRLTTLMHDSQYRVAIAWQNVAYNQPPHPSFFLGAGMTTPPQPNVYTPSVNPTIPGDFDLDGHVDAVDLGIWQQMYGTSQGQGFLPGDADGNRTVNGRDFLIWQQNVGQAQALMLENLEASLVPSENPTSSPSTPTQPLLSDEAFILLGVIEMPVMPQVNNIEFEEEAAAFDACFTESEPPTSWSAQSSDRRESTILKTDDASDLPAEEDAENEFVLAETWGLGV